MDDKKGGRGPGSKGKLRRVKIPFRGLSLAQSSMRSNVLGGRKEGSKESSERGSMHRQKYAVDCFAEIHLPIRGPAKNKRISISNG